MTEMLCIRGVFIGELSMGLLMSAALPDVDSCEDGYASNGEPGLANFATSMLDALEAQGRGCSHGHMKGMGVPRTIEAKLR